MTPELHPVVPLRPREARPQKSFCGHCGRPPEVDAPSARVCSRCGLGLVLHAPADVAPAPGDPFLVIDGALTVCALSGAAEELLGVPETKAVNRHVSELLSPAEVEGATEHNLVTMLAWAARGDDAPRDVAVRPANTFGVRLWARIGACGPPRAALMVLADAR